MKTINILSIVGILFLIGGMSSILSPQNAEATGGAGDIKTLIDPIIERAITALQNNNTELALEEITTLKNELNDTFEAEDEDEDD